MKKFFTDILAPSGKWSFGRSMLLAWFAIMCWFAVSNGRAFGKVLTRMFDDNAATGAAAVPYLDSYSYFLLGVFIVLCGYVFAGKTNLSVGKGAMQLGEKPADPAGGTGGTAGMGG